MDAICCSPVNPITNVLPLVLVLSVSLAKEAFEDRKRAAKDKEVALLLKPSLAYIRLICQVQGQGRLLLLCKLLASKLMYPLETIDLELHFR